VNWLLLGGLCIIWGAFLLPHRKPRGVSASDFERGLRVLSEMREPAQPPGRWVLMPRPEERFVGSGSRGRARVRERRRRVLTVLGEAAAFTGLIGAFPPLRPMWILTGVVGVLLGMYLLLLLRLRPNREARRPERAVVLPQDEMRLIHSSPDGLRYSAQRAAAH
jgi:hypothetical protein